jgi:hypothetical protein
MRSRRLALRTEPGENYLMASHHIPCPRLNGSRRVIHHTARHLRDGATIRAADMLVMAARSLIACLSVAYVDTIDLCPLLKCPDRSQDGREVCARNVLPDRGEQLVERPRMMLLSLNQGADRIGDRTWSGHKRESTRIPVAAFRLG